MMFYTGNPEFRQYEQRARKARAEAVAGLMRRLRHGLSALARRPAPARRQRTARVACHD